MGYTPDLDAQIAAELGAIRDALLALTGLASRWSGRVELVPGADFRGRKRYSCDIEIDRDLAGREQRWRTLIHEALHAVSAGLNARDFLLYRGWEEGVVEQTQRLLRPAVLEHIGVQADESVFEAQERIHAFDPYLEQLDRLRSILVVDQDTFYLSLLKTPLRDRPGYVYHLGQKLPSKERRGFLTVFARARSILGQE